MGVPASRVVRDSATPGRPSRGASLSFAFTVPLQALRCSFPRAQSAPPGAWASSPVPMPGSRRMETTGSPTFLGVPNALAPRSQTPNRTSGPAVRSSGAALRQGNGFGSCYWAYGAQYSARSLPVYASQPPVSRDPRNPRFRLLARLYRAVSRQGTRYGFHLFTSHGSSRPSLVAQCPCPLWSSSGVRMQQFDHERLDVYNRAIEFVVLANDVRSEERRVGEERRARRSPAH